MRIMAVSLLALFLVVFHSVADAKTYECEAVDEVSRLGISPRSAVAVSADEHEKECKFSVNGAKVSSPSQQLISQAFGALLVNRGLFSNNWSSDLLAALLLSAGPDTEIAAMSRILGGGRSQIQSCIDNLSRGQNGSVDFGNPGAQGFCVVTNRDPISYGPIKFRFDEQDSIPVLLLFVRRNRLTNLLAIPRPQ